MKTLGIDEFSANPKGSENNAIAWDTFLMEAYDFIIYFY